jgi:2,3-bisphosphoglycerate-dependent phosphoglycerate mutase
VAQDPRTWRWMRFNGHDRAEYGRWWASVDMGIAHYLDGGLVGHTSFLNDRQEDRVVEIGNTWLNPRAWGTGANTEAKYLLMRHAFEDEGYLRVEFKTDALNERSRPALEKVGATFEGVARKHQLVRGGERRDSAWYAVIDDDWPEVRASLEQQLRAGMTVEVVFETHATSEDNEAGIATGWLPGRLSAAGREQARELGERRRHDGIAVVFTSDLQRAVETAEIAFACSGIPILADPRLRECDYGELNGTPEPIRDRAEHIDVPYPGGESWRGAVERVTGFLEELRAERNGERVVVIGHSATRLALEVLVRGRPLEEVMAEPFDWQPGWEYVL